MKNLSKKYLSGGFLLIAALMGINLINFVFNAYLGRVLSFETFGVLALINTFLYLAGVAFNAVYATANHNIAYVTGPKTKQGFLHKTLYKTVFISLIISIMWIAATPFIDSFFKIDNFIITLSFTPIITLGVITAVSKGYLQGTFKFHLVAIIIIAEALFKLLLAWIFVEINLSYWVYLAIPFSTLFACTMAFGLTSKDFFKGKSVNSSSFPKKFFGAAVLTGVASMAFLSFDLLLVKHFLSPVAAGQYALLSLIGKIVFFFGSLPSALIITYISSDEGNNRDTRNSFYKIFSVTIILSLGAFIAIGIFGNMLIPLLFGAKAKSILPYLTLYSAAIALYVISGTFVTYHLAKRQYIFPVLSLISAIVMCVGISLFHADILHITYTIFTSSFISFVIIGGAHVFETANLFRFKERFSV